jgi:hypothetical protein
VEWLEQHRLIVAYAILAISTLPGLILLVWTYFVVRVVRQELKAWRSLQGGAG